MTLLREKSAPTLDDAHRAADCLAQLFDPGEILLFGSVAKGNPSPGSDLDLVLVFDDLGDYSQRRAIVGQAQEAVQEVTGFASDIRVTDRPEWEIRSKRCRSTFEAHIAAHAVTLSSRPPKTAINWRKEIGMAPSDEQQAADSLENTTHALNSLLPLLIPSEHESDALLAGDLRYADSMERSRLLNTCAQAQLVMETALKSLIHALKGPHPEHTHSIGGLLHAAARQVGDRTAIRLAATLGSVTPDEASVWRETGTYPADRRIQGDPERATPEFVAGMATAAINMTRVCIGLIADELGSPPPAAELALTQCQRIERELAAL